MQNLTLLLQQLRKEKIFTLMIEGLMSSLYSHEERMNQRINFTHFKQALQSKTSTRGRGGQQGGRSHGRGRGRHDNFNNKDEDSDTNSFKGRGNTSRPKNKSHIQCFRCKKYGHYKSQC